MRVLKYVSRVAAVVAAVVVCVCCKGYKQIPEDELADIFKDMYLLNAYIETHPLRQADSVDVYAPVLEKHGYTTEDFRRTIMEASRRKSFRLGDVVEVAVAKMEAESAAIAEQVRIINMVDSMAYAVSRHEVFRDSLIEIRSMADSSAMKLVVPLENGSGRFDVTYYYTLDSLDRNKDLENKHYLRNGAGVSRASSTLTLRPRGRVKYDITLTGAKDVETLEGLFGNYPENPKRMHLTIDSLVVVRHPDLEEAHETLLRQFIDYRLMIDGREYDEYEHLATDSCALRIVPPLVDTQCDSLAVE